MNDEATTTLTRAAEKARARAHEVHALIKEGAPWTDSSRERALKVRGRALKVPGRTLKVRARALEVRLWPHNFFTRALFVFARALFWARCIPFGEGPSLSRARPSPSRARRAQKRALPSPLRARPSLSGM